MLNILCDLDGVLVAWSEAAMKLVGLDPTTPENKEFLYSGKELEQLVGADTLNKAIEEAGSEFWYNLRPANYCNELLGALRGIENTELHFCTSPGKWSAGGDGKIRYIRDKFGSSNYVLTKNKYLLATDRAILIDDMTKHTNAFGLEGGWVWTWSNLYRLEEDPEKAEQEIKALTDNIRNILRVL